MSETIKVASRLPMPLRITEPMENPEKPGEAHPLRSAVLAGMAHPEDPQPAVTEVDADLFRRWLEANPHHPAVQAGALTEIKGDPPEPSYGFAPALEEAKADADKASKGSTLKDRRVPSAKDMAATSDTPPDNSPRSQVPL